MIEDPKPADTTLPPLRVNTWFDGLRIKINQMLLELMREHLTAREDREAVQVGTGFDRWLHRQISESLYNSA